MLENIFTPADAPAEIETITEEERFMFRKLGLKMSAFLLVGASMGMVVVYYKFDSQFCSFTSMHGRQAWCF